MVLISTSDNEQFSVDRDVAERSLLIKQLIEDIGESDVEMSTITPRHRGRGAWV